MRGVVSAFVVSMILSAVIAGCCGASSSSPDGSDGTSTKSPVTAVGGAAVRISSDQHSGLVSVGATPAGGVLRGDLYRMTDPLIEAAKE